MVASCVGDGPVFGNHVRGSLSRDTAHHAGRAGAFVSSCARRRVDCVGEWERVLASLRRVCRTVGHGGGAGRVGRARLCWRVKRVLAGLRCWRGERVLSRPCAPPSLPGANTVAWRGAKQ